ncbi:MAG: hypothetical protein ACKVS9_03490 [Phycisphaerae bacterium]
MLALLVLLTILWIAHLRWLYLEWREYSWYRSNGVWMIPLIAGSAVGITVAILAFREVCSLVRPPALGALHAPEAPLILGCAYWAIVTCISYVWVQVKLARIPDERRCPKCGYCLDGASDIGGFLRCSECGKSTSVAKIEKLRSHRLLMSKLARLFWKFD